jgi:hypothetical protein
MLNRDYEREVEKAIRALWSGMLGVVPRRKRK